MDRYHLWFDLRPDARPDQFVAAVEAFLGHLRERDLCAGHLLERRKLGFGPEGLGEWHLAIAVRDLAQLQDAFERVEPRQGEAEALHAAVWLRVTGIRFGLTRDVSSA